MIILGLDIGGANTKAAIIKFEEHKIKQSVSHIEYFPFWEKTLTDIPEMLKKVISKLQEHYKFYIKDIDFIATSITAELSDAFQTKKEGIQIILKALTEVFSNEKMRFISTESKFLNFKEAQNNYLAISAANWVSTALFLGSYIPNCILVDGGSTTVDIIPIYNSLPVAKGKTDIQRLTNHELIYTGGLRATIPSITHFVPYKGKTVRVSFEKFALISDVHRILKNITESEYINETADKRSKSLENCYARLSKVICMDINTISIENLDELAKYIYEKQLKIIIQEIELFMSGLIKRYPQFLEDPMFVITGSSADFLIRKSLDELGYNNISNFKDIIPIPDNTSSSAFAVAGALNLQLKISEKK